MRALREVKLDENGAEVENLFVGDIGLFRYRYHWVDDESEREKITEENKNLAAGDGEILWEIGGSFLPFTCILFFCKLLNPLHI